MPSAPPNSHPAPAHCRQKQCHLPERKSAARSPAGLPIQSVSHSCRAQPPTPPRVAQRPPPGSSGLARGPRRPRRSSSRLLLGAGGGGHGRHLHASATPFTVFFPPPSKLTFRFTHLNDASDKMRETSEDELASGSVRGPAGRSVPRDRVFNFAGGRVFSSCPSGPSSSCWTLRPAQGSARRGVHVRRSRLSPRQSRFAALCSRRVTAGWAGEADALKIGLTEWSNFASFSAKIWIEKRRTNIPVDVRCDVTSSPAAKVNTYFQISALAT